MSGQFDSTVTLLFSDIRGFTEYTNQHGDETAFKVLQEHNAIVRKQIETFGGKVVKTQGDSFMVAFTTAKGAIICAVGKPVRTNPVPSAAAVVVVAGTVVVVVDVVVVVAAGFTVTVSVELSL